VLHRRVDLHAIDATPARCRGDAGSSPLDGASMCPTYWLISTQVMIQVPPGCGPGMPLQIQTPTGQIVQIVVPAGAGPGSQFQVGY
jgi:uncharacterized RDD family membrane protein YckC